jgi:hypothetical protein
MTIDKIRSLYLAEPFQPFVIHLADGRNVPVISREFISTVPSGRTVVVSDSDDHVHIIDLLLVTDLEVKPKSNGKTKRRG